MPRKKLFAVKKSGLGSAFLFDGVNSKKPSVTLALDEALAECYWWEKVGKPINARAVLHDVSKSKDLDWVSVMRKEGLEKRVLELYGKKRDEMVYGFGQCCSDEE